MTKQADIITRGREAWGRLKSQSTFADWLAVGRAIEIGKQAALKNAGCNRPVGSKYNRAIGNWLRANGRATLTLETTLAVREFSRTTVGRVPCSAYISGLYLQL